MGKIHEVNQGWNDPSPSREDLKEKVRERFGRYGRSATALILEFVKRPNWIFEMFEKAGIPYAGKVDAQLANLERHLARHPEPEAFLEFLRAEIARQLKPTPRAQDEAARSRPQSREVPMLGSVPIEDMLPLKPATPVIEIETAPAAAAIPPAPEDEPTAKLVVAPPSPKGEPAAEPRCEAAEAGPAIIIDVPGYSGPERRRGPGDRRSYRERRSRVDAIGKNRRFGGDRRKSPVGRRELLKRSA